MNSSLRVPLSTTPEQALRLLDLQAAFAQACNALAPLVQKTGVWNRVALHHMAYKLMREQFPQLGSQMVCNAIYSVSRHSRVLFQNVKSPFYLSKQGDKPLPLMRFSDSCPVYFDRHTLSLKEGQLSMYTLDGRMRFQLDLQPQDERNFHALKLREVVLTRVAAPTSVQGVKLAGVRSSDGAGASALVAVPAATVSFELQFAFSDGSDAAAPGELNQQAAAELPEYVMVEEIHENA